MRYQPQSFVEFRMFWCVAISVVACGGVRGESVAMRDVVTHQQLAMQLRKSDQSDPMKKLKAATGEDPSVLNRPKDLLSQSDIISFNGLATLVPKRAILQVPKNYSDRIGFKEGSKIVSWLDFLAANRGWITTVEVNRTQAEGNLDIAEETKKQMSKSGNLIVATFMTGPISVLPLKENLKPETSKP